MPEQDEAAEQPFSFLIWREDGRLQLQLRRGGRVAPLGAHADAGELIAAACAALNQEPSSPPRR